MNIERPGLWGDPPVAADPEALPDRKELSLVAFERTRMPLVITNAREPDHPIVLTNQAFLDLTGYSASEVIGRNCRFLQGPLSASLALDEIRRGLEEKREISVELINYRKDGSTFWNQLAISPVFSEDGDVIYHFASQRDVSKQRRAQEMEAAERLLLMEVDHRSMNALALVQSIVRLSNHDVVEDYAAAIEGRVDALARAHRHLAHVGWAGTSVGALVSLETSAHVHRVTSEGADIILPARVVQSIALVLHELYTNALKHGALSNVDGRVLIRWQALDERIQINWKEANSPRSGAEAKSGFGWSIIRGVIENQLGGTISISWAEDGIETILVF